MKTHIMLLLDQFSTDVGLIKSPFSSKNVGNIGILGVKVQCTGRQQTCKENSKDCQQISYFYTLTLNRFITVKINSGKTRMIFNGR